ncbi:amidase domain-containing protein [Clostridium botulinum]|uniref:amidase domain-containing protein n=1 Tax=Clostridium botulinum TaxID=1491 RepID=UPI003A7FC5D3
MSKRILSLIFSITLLSSSFIFANTTYVKASSNNTINTVNLTNYNLTNEDLAKIKNNINKLLSSQYEIMKTGEFKSNSDIIKNSNLLQLMDKTNEFKSKWYKKVNLKISNYQSSLNIDNLKKISNNTYILKVTYNIDFTLTDATENSSSKENYKLEIQNIDGNWYITKMLNLDEDLDGSTKQDKKRSILIEFEDEFKDYENIVDDKMNSINNISKDINNYAQEYKSMINRKGNEMHSKRYSGYNSNLAVEYAKKWAKGRNPNYKDWGDNDCNNFVSQAVYAGGIPISSTWYDGSYAWIRVINFYNYMRSAGYTVGGDDSANSTLGDVIQFYDKSKDNWSHSVIITGSTDDGWLYSGHSNDRLNYPLANVYPTSTYSKIRYIKFWH